MATKRGKGAKTETVAVVKGVTKPKDDANGAITKPVKPKDKLSK